MINPLGGKCVVLVLRPILTIFKEGSTLYKGARISKFVWLLGINETSTTPNCSGPIPVQKSRGNSVPGVVFSNTMP